MDVRKVDAPTSPTGVSPASVANSDGLYSNPEEVSIEIDMTILGGS
ncbi:hypothetical protein PPL_12598 [Heterostelium album PN500]|uniref:Uncharacterized protein n=1 Tax=Heterostelium pallidum (strain ATCC 26659 / Pp 5 / PN500) TaxID=670386 RepID=D3BN21_HETP5|nr:hypothetical protein PPL_12598 [Heterostelium album PN500]EFA77383.1 hypothetical protein PPL_12598 [Heterostelium album PN500]|eukprot:XP_020429512.1 hypothetical protein PPL_12598 [Heterostelium album PN500]